MSRPASALLPAALLGLFLGWSGTLCGGATASGAALGAIALLGVVFWGASSDLDPLRLGRFGRFLLPLLLSVVLAGVCLSPVPRAGRVAMLLLPALLLLPSVVTRCWQSEERRLIGHLGIAGVVGGISVLALWEGWVSGDPPGGPLGHHLLLVACLLPLIGFLLEDLRSSWRPLAWGSRLVVPMAVLAILATGSVLGVAGLCVLASGLLPRRWQRIGPMLVLMLGLGLAGVVGGAIPVPSALQGSDSSWLARRAYWEAGWEGFKSRPWLGWGLGSTPWTLANELDPKPGINPAGEVVGDLHSWPLQWLRETGVLGVLALSLLVLAWWRARLVEARACGGFEVLPVGLLALGLYSVAGVSLGTSAPWVALAVVLGAALQGPTPSQRLDALDTHGGPHWIWRAYALGAALLLLPSMAAHLAYEAAIAGPTGPQQVETRLRRAVAWDPEFPLYGVALQRATSMGPTGKPWSSDFGVSQLWLLHQEQTTGTARSESLRRAIDLDPFGWAAPYLLMIEDPTHSEAPALGARAVLLEPRLIASDYLRSRLGLRALIAMEIRRWSGVEAGVREALSRALVSTAPPGTAGRLVAEWDAQGEPSPSIHLFRRSPAQFELVSVPIDRDLADRLDLPSAAVLRSTSRDAFGPGAD